MAFTVHVDIVSAEQEIFSGQAEMVFAPAILGEMGIAPHHTPLITNLAPGEVRLKLPGGEEQGFYVSGGILEVQPHVVTVLSDTAMRAEDLDEAGLVIPRHLQPCPGLDAHLIECHVEGMKDAALSVDRDQLLQAAHRL